MTRPPGASHLCLCLYWCSRPSASLSMSSIFSCDDIGVEQYTYFFNVKVEYSPSLSNQGS